MSRVSDAELRPRNGHTLIVGHACRISGCTNQKELSLEDQQDNARDAIKELFDGPFELRVVAATKAKGERLDRPELEHVENAYGSREYDIFVFDDLSRLLRGGDAARLLGIGVDHGTRTICINDGIDTNDPGWEVDALTASSENVAHNEQTSKRIKQKCMNRFKKFGQPTGRPIAGYIVPDGVKSYDGWLKNEKAEKVIRAGAELLKKTLDCAVVADFFNEQGFPPGIFTRPTGGHNEWNGVQVRRFFGNPLLKGMPQRGKKHTVKHHGTGRRVSVSNPKGPNYYGAPHLAFLSESEFDDLNALLDAANMHHRRKPVNGTDPLLRRRRDQSCFPGLLAQCWYCGWHYVWGANGITDNLMCSNSREWHCWHSVGFSGPEATKKLIAEISRQLESLKGFDEQFAEMVAAGGTDVENKFSDELQRLGQEEETLRRHKKNLLASIKDLGPRPFLLEEVVALEAKERELLLRRHRLAQRDPTRLVLPKSMSVLRGLLEEEFSRLALDSPSFGTLLRTIVPAFFVRSVRLCDGGHLLPQARVHLNLAGTFPDCNLVPGLERLLTRELTFNLFDPPQRERIREEAVSRAATGLKPKAISQSIEEKPTATAVRNALKLHEQMVSLGLDTPYVTVLEPPNDYPKLRRHQHPRYDFRSLEGYQRPAW